MAEEKSFNLTPFWGTNPLLLKAALLLAGISSSTPVHPTRPEQRRLIWAYYEAQSLESLNLPNASELFGEELGHLVTGQYPGGIKKSEIMHRCYRTPHPMLTAAHGIGMGLLRPGGMLTGMTRTEDWRAIGYEVTGRFVPNQQITLKCPPQNSPNPLPELWTAQSLRFRLTALSRKNLAP